MPEVKRTGMSTEWVIVFFEDPSIRRSRIGEIETSGSDCAYAKVVSMKQWEEPESTNASLLVQFEKSSEEIGNINESEVQRVDALSLASGSAQEGTTLTLTCAESESRTSFLAELAALPPVPREGPPHELYKPARKTCGSPSRYGPRGRRKGRGEGRSGACALPG